MSYWLLSRGGSRFCNVLREVEHAVLPDYMDRQQQVTAKMRAILVDWLVGVHRKCSAWVWASPVESVIAKDLVDVIVDDSCLLW